MEHVQLVTGYIYRHEEHFRRVMEEQLHEAKWCSRLEFDNNSRSNSLGTVSADVPIASESYEMLADRYGIGKNPFIIAATIKYSAVDASVYLSLSAVTAVLNAFVSARFGPDLLILVSAVTLCREFQIVFDGIGEAVSPVFGVYLGEENHSGLRSIYKLANRTAIIEGIVVTFALMVFAPFAPEVLKVTSPEVADQVVICIRMTALGSTFASLLYLLTSYYLVINQIALALVVCFMRDMLLCVPLALAFGKLWGPQGMFVGIAAAPALTYVILLNFLTRRMKAFCSISQGMMPLLPRFLPMSSSRILRKWRSEEGILPP